MVRSQKHGHHVRYVCVDPKVYLWFPLWLPSCPSAGRLFCMCRISHRELRIGPDQHLIQFLRSSVLGNLLTFKRSFSTPTKDPPPFISDPNKRHRALGPEDPSPRGARIQQWPGEFASGPLSEAAGAGPEVTAAMPPPFSESFTDASQPAVLLATGIPMSLAGYTPDPSQAPPAAPGDAYVGLNPQPNPPPSGFLEGP